MNILIIEDEFHLADMIRDFFVSKGDSVQVCTDGAEGYKLASDSDFDAVILDVMLPGMDGFSILSNLRNNRNKIPILMLTARSSLDDKLLGLGGGAQDYLTKPFEIEELYARVRLLGIKNNTTLNPTESISDSAQGLLSYGSVHLNCASRDLNCETSGKKVLLPAKEYSLMELFLQNPGNILSKEQITAHIWGYDSEAEYNHEEVYISFLRKKLKYIEADISIDTVRGAGYRLIKMVE